MTVLDLWNDPAVTVLATMRGLALLVAGPVFGHPALPMRVRVAFAMGLALALAPPGLEAFRGIEPGLALAEMVAGRSTSLPVAAFAPARQRAAA